MKLFPLHILPNDTTIDFMRHRRPVLALMLVLLVASIAIIGLKGFNYALEFTGGTVVEARFDKSLDVDAVRKQLDAIGYGHAEVQTFGGGNDLLSMHGYTSGSLVGGGGNDTLSFSLDNQAGTALKSGGSFSAFLTGGTHASGFETLMLDLSGGHNDTLTIDSTSITNLRNAMGGAVNDILIKGDHAGGTGGQDVVQFDNSSHTWSQNSADTSHAGYNSWHDDQGHTVYVDQQLAVAFIGG